MDGWMRERLHSNVAITDDKRSIKKNSAQKMPIPEGIAL